MRQDGMELIVTGKVRIDVSHDIHNPNILTSQTIIILGSQLSGRQLSVNVD